MASGILEHIDLSALLERISSMGAASAPVLRQEQRISLLEEARRYTYRTEEEVVGSGDRTVRQQMASFESFAPASRFVRLRGEFQDLLHRELASFPEHPFATPLELTSMVLQRYRKGSLGITPHRDSSRYINLICIFVIGGKGRFFVCADRSGNDSQELDAAPGNVILMKAPGFMGSRRRPFHYVRDVEEERYTFGLRQRRPEPPA